MTWEQSRPGRGIGQFCEREDKIQGGGIEGEKRASWRLIAGVGASAGKAAMNDYPQREVLRFSPAVLPSKAGTSEARLIQNETHTRF